MRVSKCGIASSNGYLNFLRDYRLRCRSLGPVEAIIEGAKEWKTLTDKEKRPYRDMPSGCLISTARLGHGGCKPCHKAAHKAAAKTRKCAPKKKAIKKARSCKVRKAKKTRKACVVRKARKACKPRKAASKRKAGGKNKCKTQKCMKAGPLTNNGYLNFLRVFRRRNCGLDPRSVIVKGAKVWCRMTPEQKERFNRLACTMSTSKRRRGTKFCSSAIAQKEKQNKRNKAKKGRKC